MTTAAVDALRSDHAALAAMAGTFSADEWNAPSGCDGWAVRDVVSHMTQLFRLVVDPDSLPEPDPSGNTERTQDRWVDAMRPFPADEVLADYIDLGAQALVTLATFQDRESTVDLGDLGTHPLHLIANAYAFDHYTHIRVDMLAPGGPLQREAPTTDERHVGAVVDWMVAGLPQMSAAGLAWLNAPVNLEIAGPGGTTIGFGPVRDGCPARSEAGADDAVATVATTSTDFVLWGTGRRGWRDLDVAVGGDREIAERFCDAIHIF